MKNNSSNIFTEISSEAYRTYVFNEDQKITIKEPTHLSVSASGGHRVFNAKGISYYIPSGWLCIYWEAKEGQPNFVK